MLWPGWALMVFLSTPSAGRATCKDLDLYVQRRDFYPRPPRGGRRTGQIKSCKVEHISIHALRGEGDVPKLTFAHLFTYFYPRPPRGGRQFCSKFQGDPQKKISIHALRGEGDVLRPKARHDRTHFYPRPPRGGRRIGFDAKDKTRVFLSTPSAGRATFSPASLDSCDK